MSYNSLHVPLGIGTWQCTLVLAREYYRHGSGYWDAFADWGTRREREREIEDDRRTFNRYFRPNYDFRRTSAPDIDAIRSFLTDHLNVVHWDLPTDNAAIERALKRAVRDGMIVPVINRDWRSLPMTFRPTPAPLRWPAASGGGVFGSGGGTTWAVFRNAGPGPLVWDGEPVLRGPYDPSTVEAQLKAARAALSTASRNDDGGDDGLSLPGAFEAVAGTVLGGDSGPNDGGDGTSDLAKSLTDGSDADVETSTPLSDAQPFEYSADQLSGDTTELAGIPFDGVPNTWVENAPEKKKQWRMYGLDGTPAVDIDFDDHHGQPDPHAHNWDDQGRDHGWPVSILP
ncbi:hypothetical protein [Paraburkholderia diazotrophica]|uniref:Uncharacterized protein n=1 Tax=Paraburkholderia diazotrophica TaxID=667676 RepID=A0A1H6RW94_9BURK|nr:hypothetical protein [Paraburkholderia diazotrophica]SEI55472.1 hypothetical protein SAMN05192539_1002302 [Paraburkholderia diazotrophica]